MAVAIKGGVKVRPSAVETGNRGIVALWQYCTDQGLIFQGEPREDYGVDCYLEVQVAGAATNFHIGVQCKAGPSHRHNRPDGSFHISVTQRDVAYWAAANIPVLFVYYDTDENALYWRHVQAVVADAGSMTEVKHVRFTSSDNVQQKSLAEYARQLVQATPSTADRVAIFSSPMTCVIDGCSTLIGPSDVVTAADFFDPDAPFYSSVVGYSADDRWVLIRKVVDHGGLPSEIYAEFFDTLEWAALELPVLVQPDDREEPDELPMNPTLVTTAKEAIDRIGFFRPQKKLLSHDFIHDVSDLGNRPEVAFVFGEERFELSVIGRREHRALVLENARFSPPRRGTILTLPTVPMRLIGAEFMGIGEAQQLLGVCELMVSPSGKRVTIGAITNLDHVCWGAPSIFHWHTTVEEIRRNCIEALLI